MPLSKAEMKILYKSVVKEIILEEKENEKKNEQEKLDKYMEIINALTIHHLLDSDIDYENADEDTEGHINLKLWNFPDEIQEHLKEKFKEPLEALNKQFVELMEPVKEFVDDLRKKLVHKELDPYNMNKGLLKKLVKKRIVKKNVVTL
jgi:hypothetical protein